MDASTSGSSGKTGGAPVRFIILMGVSGSGKTTLGTRLAAVLGWDFYDADDFHPPANIAKMAAGRPLNDGDRAPWLAALRARIDTSLAAGRPGVLACSALKARYREALAAGNPAVRFVHLRGDYATIYARMRGRAHYMRPEMLRSQFADLEEPVGALVFDVTAPLAELVQRIVAALGLRAPPPG